MKDETKLIVDIGNTTAKVAIFKGSLLIDRIISDNSNHQRLLAFCQQHQPQKAIVSSVIALSTELKSALESLAIPVLFLNSETPLPICNKYKTQTTLGSDRIAAAVGAYSAFPNRNILVIDAGTAITYEFINERGEYEGGTISPGIKMRLKALHHFTNQLPIVTPEGENPWIGQDTATAIRSGVLHGVELEISGYMTHFSDNYSNLLIFLTGGDEIPFDRKFKSCIFADSFLVLKGLNRILDYNDNL